MVEIASSTGYRQSIVKTQIAVNLVRGQQVLDGSHDEPLKALHDDRCECNRMLVIVTGQKGLLRHGDNGGGLGAHGNDGAAQRDASCSAHVLYVL